MYTFSENSIDFISTDWFFIFMKIKMENTSYLQVRLPITDFVMQIWSSILEILEKKTIKRRTKALKKRKIPFCHLQYNDFWKAK